MSLAEKVKEIVKGEVSDKPSVLRDVATDASIFELHPELVVAPRSVEDIKELVKFVEKEKGEYPHLSLTARSAGTDMSGGPLSESIVINFLPHFAGSPEVDKEKMEAIVLPGTYYRDFEKATLSAGLLMPSYPASREFCTIGGMVASNSGGEKSLSYGKTIDYVKEIEVVLADGESHILKELSAEELKNKMSERSFEGDIYKQMHDLIKKNKKIILGAKPKVSKNSAGYNLWEVNNGEMFNLAKLLVGSQGTLGLITKIKFSLIKPKEHSVLLVIFIDHFQELAKVVPRVLEYKPESFEAYDDHTLRLAVRYMPDLLKRLGVKKIFTTAIKFWPEIKMILTGGVPKLVLVAEFTGHSEAEVYQKAGQAEVALGEFDIGTRIAKNDDEENKYWAIRRESFNLLRKHVRGLHSAPFIDDVIVSPETLSKFLPRLTEIMDKYKITYTVAGHIGDGNLHIIPLLDFKRGDLGKIIRELSQKVYALVIEFGGSITGEHNDGLIRTPFLEQMYGKEVVELFRQTKQIFDPQNIFNPGKKVPLPPSPTSPTSPTPLAYALTHLRHDW